LATPSRGRAGCVLLGGEAEEEEEEEEEEEGAGRGGRRMRCVVVKSVRERSVRDDAGDDDILCTRLI
jgi:hypothetical protein